MLKKMNGNKSVSCHSHFTVFKHLCYFSPKNTQRGVEAYFISFVTYFMRRVKNDDDFDTHSGQIQGKNALEASLDFQ